MGIPKKTRGLGYQEAVALRLANRIEIIALKKANLNL